MADASDVELALVNAIAAVLYPTGTSSAPLVAPARVYRGWPNNATLDADLAAGTLNVTVYPRRGMARNTTRYEPDTKITANPAPTLTASVSGAAVTFGGTGGVGQVAGVKFGTASYAYRLVLSDTPATVAAQFAATISSSSASGAVLTLPTNLAVTARVAADVPTFTEVRRQEMQFQISFWCASPSIRDASCSAVDAMLAATPWLALADGSSGRLIWSGGDVTDRSENSNAYRRDLFYSVEFPTAVSATLPLMIFGIDNITAASAGTVSTVS